MAEQVSFVVFVGEVLRTEQIALLAAQSRVEREQDLFCHVNSICRCDSLGQLHVVAFARCDIAGRFLFVGNGVEAIEQVCRSIAAFVADTFPYCIVKRLAKALCDSRENEQRSRCVLLSCAFACSTGAKNCRNRRVRLELSHYRAEVGLQAAIVDIEVSIRSARSLIRCELCISANSAYILRIADTRATRHILESVLQTDDRKHK